MKKFLLSMAVVALGASYAAADEVTFDFINNDYGMTRLSGSTQDYNADPQTIVNGPVTITLNGENNSRLWADGLRIYKGLTDMNFSVSGGSISEIVFTAKADKGGANISLIEGQPGSYDGATTTNATSTWTGDAASVSFKSNLSKGNQAFGSIKVVYTATGAAKKNADLAFSTSSVTLTLGETFVQPTLTKSTTAAVNYSCNNADVATVDAATGEVTIIAAGEAMITASTEENDEYYAGSASYTITVKEPLAENVIYSNDCFTKDCGFTSVYAEGAFNPWSIDSKYGLKATAFAGGACKASDAVMASPVLNLKERKNVKLTFEHAANQFKLDGTLIDPAEMENYITVVAREEGAEEWTRLEGVVYPAEFSWNFVEGGEINLDAFIGKTMQIGFRYVSTENLAGTWEIKNVVVTGDKDNNTVVLPTFGDEAEAEYFNLQGVRVANPANGLYIRVVNGKATKVVVK